MQLVNKHTHTYTGENNAYAFTFLGVNLFIIFYDCRWLSDLSSGVM